MSWTAISTRDTQFNVAQVLAHLCGWKVALTLPATPEIPATVDVKMSESDTYLTLYDECDALMRLAVLAVFILTQDKALGKAIYNDFLPGALKSGRIKPAPKADVVGHGVEFIQTAVDKLKAGVSGSKVVVTL